jgi:hypothetical protein
MKTALFAIILLISSQAFAWGILTLQSCDYRYIPEIQKYVYVGTYLHQSGQTFTYTFDSYCPSILDL